MKLEAQSGESTCTFEFDERGGTFRLSLDGREIEGDVLQPEPGVFSFMVGHRVVEFHVSKLPGIETRRVVTVTGTTDVRIIDRKHRSPGDEAEGDGQQIMLAPMPGKVVAILAAVGDTVERGQGVLVVEAMKMQNELKSHRDGTIKEIRASEGENVNAGDVLVVIE